MAGFTLSNLSTLGTAHASMTLLSLMAGLTLSNLSTLGIAHASMTLLSLMAGFLTLPQKVRLPDISVAFMTPFQ
jgi:hypothetical protein